MTAEKILKGTGGLFYSYGEGKVRYSWAYDQARSLGLTYEQYGQHRTKEDAGNNAIPGEWFVGEWLNIVDGKFAGYTTR